MDKFQTNLSNIDLDIVFQLHELRSDLYKFNNGMEDARYESTHHHENILNPTENIFKDYVCSMRALVVDAFHIINALNDKYIKTKNPENIDKCIKEIMNLEKV